MCFCSVVAKDLLRHQPRSTECNYCEFTLSNRYKAALAIFGQRTNWRRDTQQANMLSHDVFCVDAPATWDKHHDDDDDVDDDEFSADYDDHRWATATDCLPSSQHNACYGASSSGRKREWLWWWESKYTKVFNLSSDPHPMDHHSVNGHRIIINKRVNGLWCAFATF